MVRDPKRRKQLLQAALARFSGEGYDVATTRSIASDAGVSETVLFRHFGSKRELFLTVLGEFGPRQIFHDIAASLDDAATRGDALRHLLTCYLDTTREHRPWLRVVFQESRRDTEAREALAGQYGEVGQALRRVMRDGVEAGEFRADLAPAALQVIRLAVRGFVARSTTQPPDDWAAERDGFVDNLVSVIAESLRAEASDSEQGKLE